MDEKIIMSFDEFEREARIYGEEMMELDGEICNAKNEAKRCKKSTKVLIVLLDIMICILVPVLGLIFVIAKYVKANKINKKEKKVEDKIQYKERRIRNWNYDMKKKYQQK